MNKMKCFFIAGLVLFSLGYGVFAQEGTKVETRDRNEDGTADIWLYRNEKGEHIKSEADRDYDGKPDYWRYLDNGRIEREEGDLDFDGELDIWVYYSDGKKARGEKDNNKDGKPDMFIYYDQTGQMAGLQKDTDFDGKIDETVGVIPKIKKP